ncbi:MAG: CoB--CoM heterodisulfide reductase iron-sulfur subunit B family protein [Desulfomonilaceae bacterium]
MKVSYYPGCSLEGTARSYDASVRQVCRILGIELDEPKDWTCCGASPALKINNLLSVSLTARNLALMEKTNNTDVVAPCPFCSRRLKSANEELKNNPELKQKTQEVIDDEIAGKLVIHNLLGFISEQIGMEAIMSRISKPLKGLKLIPYYGCYVVKPPSVTQYDDAERPTSLDKILETLGADVLDWDFKSECCGAGLALSKTEKVAELSGRLVSEAAWRGAEMIVVVCPLCQANLDMRQGDANSRVKTGSGIPIVYFTQLIGLAFGLAPAELGLNHHIIDPVPALRQKGFVS